MALRPNLFILNLLAFATKRETETVRKAEYGPSKKQSEFSDLTQDYLAI